MSYYNIAEMYLEEGKFELAYEPLKQAEEYWTRLTEPSSFRHKLPL